MVEFIRRCKGYLFVQVKSPYLTRFFNICKAKKIMLWGVEQNGCEAKFFLSLKNFYRLKEICQSTDSRIKILNRIGYPFAIKKTLARKGFVAGVFFFFLGVYLCTGIVWKVDFTGNRRLSENEFQKFLEKEGIYPGIVKFRIDADQIEKAITNEYPYISWCCVRLEGSKLFVEVKEAEFMAESVNELSPPTDFISDYAGIVDSIITRTGSPEVVSGNQVEKGDLLISGIVPVYQDDGEIASYQFYHADGDVVLAFENDFEEKLYFQYKSQVFTENKEYFYRIIVGNMIFCFDKKADLMPYLEIEEPILQARFFKLNPVFEIHKYERHYYTLENRIYTKQEASEILKKKYRKYMESLKEKGIQICANNVKIKSDHEKMFLHAHLELKTKVGKRVLSKFTNEGN